MADFCKGWRRKIGLVTLALAMMLSAGWVRSFTVRDVYSYTEGRSMITFRSFEGGLGWQRFTPAGMFMSRGWRSDPHFKFAANDPWWRFDNFDEADIDWRWDGAGFSFGAASKKNPPLVRSLDLWIVPYWVLVLPLIVGSSFLLLIPPARLQTASSVESEGWT